MTKIIGFPFQPYYSLSIMDVTLLVTHFVINMYNVELENDELNDHFMTECRRKDVFF